MVVLPILGREMDVVRFLFQNPVLDAVRSQPGLVDFGVVDFVGVDHLGVGRASRRKTAPSYALAVLITAARIN